jgi:transposase-like protein
MEESVEYILELIGKLSKSKQEEIYQSLEIIISNPEKIIYDEEVTSLDKTRKMGCPHCDSKLTKGHGNYNGRKRFRCVLCRKTFTPLTNTPISNTKYPEKWGSFVSCCVEGLSLRKISSRLDIHIATAFHWRHKLMNAYKSTQVLSGIAEADETFFLHSEKGNKSVSQKRKPRKRGGKASTPGISNNQIPVIVGTDRDGNIIAGVAGNGRVSAKDIKQVFENHIDSKSTLCTDSHSSFKAFAKESHIEYIPLNISKGKRVVKKIYHIQNVNNSHSKIKKWMIRFNGVSSKYLQNYMNWFCLLAETKDQKDQSEKFAQKIIHPSFKVD